MARDGLLVIRGRGDGKGVAKREAAASTEEIDAYTR